jgi:hypothetical protein
LEIGRREKVSNGRRPAKEEVGERGVNIYMQVL